jgi:hypothetical protein
MAEQYTVLRMQNNVWKEIGKIIGSPDGKYLILSGFNEKDRKFFSEIGYGERSFKPSDGDEYIKALGDILAFSGRMALRKDP